MADRRSTTAAHHSQNGLRPRSPRSLARAVPSASASQHPPVTTRQGLVAIEAEHGGQQGERREHREQDDERGPERDPVEEGEAEREHAEQGDTDRQAGDEDGPPGGVEGTDHGLFGAATGEQLAAVAIHDEQGVVHSHTECDQFGQLRGELGDAERVGEDADERRPDPDGYHRGQQGEQGA